MKVGDDVWQARKVLEIPDLTRMEAEGFVDEADAGRLAVGQRVRLRLDAHPETEFRGTVKEIANAVTRRDRGNPLKHVQLTIALAETDPQRMRPAMRFQGEVEVERAEGVLLAPAVAVRSTASGPVAYREGFFKPYAVAVEVGRRNDRWVEILAGLEEGDVLVLPEEES
jgi:multidrug efflux pump subunit AcrA (membrane-fusion protein)